MSNAFPLTNNPSRLWASLIVDELYRSEAVDFYMAPGLRNAPILAAASRHEFINTYSFFDERALSYRALGAAKKEGIFPVLNCTSGTAVANFLPAVIEAYKSALPLVILTADRPVELVEIDANQTIDQTKVLKDFTCYQLNLEAPNESLTPKRLRALISNTISKAKKYSRPVHINLPLREPLDSTDILISENYLNQALTTFNESFKTTKTLLCSNYSEDNELSNLITKAKNPLLVIGKIDRIENKNDYIKTLKKIKIPKVIDTTSGIKFNFTLEDEIVPTFDHPEVYDYFSSQKIDLIIHIGGRLVSKHYYRYQEENPEIDVIHVTNNDVNHDPGFSNNIKLYCEPLSFLHTLTEIPSPNPTKDRWLNFVSKKRDIIEQSSLSMPFISKTVVENSSGLELLISNSTVVRSFDNFISPDTDYSLKTYSNRGVSGIEGFVSTLSGLADHSEKPLTLVIGDISFKHDLNSLYMLKDHFHKNINIVIVNNFGGAIFELLPIAKEKDFLPLLTTPHEDNFEKIINSFDFLDYKKCFNKSDFQEIYCHSIKEDKISVIEVFINKEENQKVYDTLKTVKL